MKILVSSFLILVSLVVFIHHLGTATPFSLSSHDTQGRPATFIEKTESSHRHIILEGSDYHRGSEFGRLLEAQLMRQEKLMISKLDQFIGHPLIQKIFFGFAMVWFHDEQDHIDEASLKEMQGVGKWAPHEFDYLADGFTRQIAYHGLHEVGQMFVDEDQVDMGCFATILESKDKNWVVGRNFDFDVDGLFDREKLLKWVFPDQGIPYVSVIWGGMVGVVTGVNQSGLFVSINAAGSDDFARVGTPTTIIAKNILTQARNIDEALEILKQSSAFITDIFVVADRKMNRVAVVEKSPKKMDVRFIEESTVVANHLTSPLWETDKNNLNRTTNLTSLSRYKRGMELLGDKVFDQPLEKAVEILRDKSLPSGKLPHLGHRGSIDAMIASQSVLYDLKNGVLYVNLGSGARGEYLGYDLDLSFAQKKPVLQSRLPQDQLSEESYQQWQSWMSHVTSARISLKDKDCSGTEKEISLFSDPDFVHYDKEKLLGDYAEACSKNLVRARRHWKSALELDPPYIKQKKYLEEKFK